MNIGVRGAGITARKKEGRFWHRGRVHQVSVLELSAGDVHAGLQIAFEQFHVANPGVYRALVALAREAREAGQEHLGISMLWEVLRWKTLVGDPRATDGYKLNNNHRSFYARAIMQQEPDLAGFFETRRSVADE